MTSPVPEAPTSGWRRTIWNVLTNWASFLISVGTSLLLSPYIVHTLGDVTYGAWVLLGSLVGYLGLLDLGARGAVTKYIATYHAAHRHEEAGLIASTALALFGAMGLVAIAASGVLALLVNHAFQVPPELAEVTRIALVISGVTLAVSLVSGVFGGIVVGMQRFDSLNVVNIVLTLGQAISVALVLYAGGGLVGIALVQLVVSVIRAIASAWLSRRLYPQLVLRARSWSRPHLRTIFSFGLSAAAIHAAGAIINYTDALVIGAFLPVAMITSFAIAAMIMDQVRTVIAGISQTLSPMVGALEGRRRADDVGEVLLQGARFATLAVLPIVVTLEIRGASFIGVWMGPAYAAPVGAVLMVLTAAIWPFAGFQVVTATMIGINRHRSLIPIFVGEAVLNLLISIVLIQRFGIVGVAWGTALPRVVVSLIAGPLFVRHHLGVSLGAYYTRTLLRPIVGVIPFALVTLAIERWWPAVNIVEFFGQVLVALPVALVGAWFGVLTSSERQAVAAALGIRRLTLTGQVG
jgi:O-antigen/teichoic acid export membrane protein